MGNLYFLVRSNVSSNCSFVSEKKNEYLCIHFTLRYYYLLENHRWYLWQQSSLEHAYLNNCTPLQILLLCILCSYFQGQNCYQPRKQIIMLSFLELFSYLNWNMKEREYSWVSQYWRNIMKMLQNIRRISHSNPQHNIIRKNFYNASE